MKNCIRTFPGIRVIVLSMCIAWSSFAQINSVDVPEKVETSNLRESLTSKKAQSEEPDINSYLNSSTRVIHQFDFNEPDNLEQFPRFWQPYYPSGFPRFTNIKSGFSHSVGRNDKKSLYVASDGRDSAIIYSGNNTSIRPSTSYLVGGYVRADKLINSRARLSAIFLDRNGKPIPDTIISSEYFKTSNTKDEWQRVEIYLPPAPPEADSIGLIAWVVQESVWNTSERMRRYISFKDVESGAWFDDISIHALPYISMRTSSPGNVLTIDEKQKLYVILTDYLDNFLRGVLTIQNKYGEVLASHEIPVTVGMPDKAREFELSYLPTGIFLARLQVFSESKVIDDRYIQFAKLADSHSESRSLARPFGVVLSPFNRTDDVTERNLLQNVLARSVKIPLWAGYLDGAQDALDRGNESNFLRGLIEDGFVLTGVFGGPPKALIESAGAYPRPLIEILSEDPRAWRDHLAVVLAPYAAYFRYWQIGPESAENIIEDERLKDALKNVRKEMLNYLNRPLLAIPGVSSLEPLEEKPDAQMMTVGIDTDVHFNQFGLYLEDYRAEKYEHFAVFLDRYDGIQFEQDRLLEDFTKRVILARHNKVNTVFVDQPWTVRETTTGRIAEPREEFLVLRTISDLIGDADPVGKLRLLDDMEGLVFQHPNSSVVVLWDPNGDEKGKEIAIQLGSADTAYDAWGRPVSLKRGKDGRQLVKVGRMPVYVPGVPNWLMKFRMQMQLTPDYLNFGDTLTQFELIKKNTSIQHVAGEIRLEVPDGWETVPANIPLSIAPSRSDTTRIRITSPHSESAGLKILTAQVTFTQDLYMEVPFTFELGLDSLEVWVLPFIDKEDLVLRQMVKNISDEVLHFRGSASVPGKTRQYQPVTNLVPGAIMNIEYRFSGGDALSGRVARLMLRELNDGSKYHNIEVELP